MQSLHHTTNVHKIMPLGTARLGSLPLTAVRPQISLRHQHVFPLAAPLAAAEAAENAATSPEPSRENKPQTVTPAWQTAIDLLNSGENFTTTITGANRSGVLVQVGKLQGFVPYKLMNRLRITGVQDVEEGAKYRDAMVGQDITVKVTQVIVPERRLICSEKAALLDNLAAKVKPGEVITGKVSSLHDFGAFVEIIEPKEYEGAEAMIPLREVCWDWIPTVSARLTKGQEVQARIVAAYTTPKTKVVLSIKRMQQDPLQENLDSVLPLQGLGGYTDTNKFSEVAANVPSGVEDILTNLSNEPGITEVTLGRQVEEQRTVSQDLELWMSKEVVQDGFNLVARAGRVVQEIHVKTGMGADEMKSTVQRVLRRVN